MPLVAAKCTQCGGELKVDSAQEAAVCTFCKMPFIVEKAINTYNTAINIHESGITADTLCDHANVLLKDGNFLKADEVFGRVLERSPRDHRAQWGKMLCKLELRDNNLDSIGAPFLAEKVFFAYNSIAYKNNRESHHHSFANKANTYKENLRSALNPEYKNAVDFAPVNIQSEYERFFSKLLVVVEKEIERRQKAEIDAQTRKEQDEADRQRKQKEAWELTQRENEKKERERTLALQERERKINALKTRNVLLLIVSWLFFICVEAYIVYKIYLTTKGVAFSGWACFIAGAVALGFLCCFAALRKDQSKIEWIEAPFKNVSAIIAWILGYFNIATWWASSQNIQTLIIAVICYAVAIAVGYAAYKGISKKEELLAKRRY